MSRDGLSQRVRAAVVGAGYWGPNLVRNVAASPTVELAAICDKDADVLTRVGAKFPGVRLLSSFDEVLGCDDIDAVVIATPSGLHHEQSLAALRAGKHVFVEKPLADSVEQAVELVNTADRTGLVLMVGHTFLYNNLVHEVKRRIDSQELGRVRYAYSQRLNLGRFRRDSDVLWTLGPHDVSILNYWFDSRPCKVCAHGRSHVYAKEKIADVCFCLLEYADGRSAHLHLSWMDPHKTRQMVVVGDKKMLVYDDADAQKHIQIYDKGVEAQLDEGFQDYADFKARLRTGDLVIPNTRLVEPLAEEISHFAECIRSGQTPRTDARHGLEVTCVLEALTLSMQMGGDTVPVDYPDIPQMRVSARRMEQACEAHTVC